MKKILVTGATGFIGNYVIKELMENNCKVIATSSNDQRASEFSWFSQVIYIPFDLRDLDDRVNYFAFFHEPDAVIHLAWEGLPNYKASFHVEENLPRHRAFLTNLIHHGLNDLVVTGTCFEYGLLEGCLSEYMECHPANAYAIAKDTLRKELTVLSNEYAVALKWVRLFYMYGSGQAPNALFSQLDKALENNDSVFNMSGGEQERDYLPVEKVAMYIVKITLQDRIRGIINCCSGQPVKLKDLIAQYLKRRNRQITLNLGYYPYSDIEPMCFWGDDTRLRSVLEKN